MFERLHRKKEQQEHHTDIEFNMGYYIYISRKSCSLYLFLVYRRLSGRTSYLGARLKNVLFHRAVEERRISPRGRRTSYLTGQFKNDASRRVDGKRRISRAFFSWNFVVAALRTCTARLCRASAVCLKTVLKNCNRSQKTAIPHR